MDARLQSDVSRLVATARNHHPRCPDWQLTMSPEAFLLLEPSWVTAPGPSAPDRRADPAPMFEGCRCWAAASRVDEVICSPIVAPGQWELPPEYVLDLVSATVAPRS